MTEPREVSDLRAIITDTAADLATNNLFWTAGCLADALIAKGVGLVGPGAACEEQSA